jgi:RecJ-like exonuclease
MSAYDSQYIAEYRMIGYDGYEDEAAEIISCPHCDEEIYMVLYDVTEKCEECPGCGTLLRIRVTDDEIVIS